MLPILLKTEEACAALATSASISFGYTPETDIFIRTGIGNYDMQAPAIVCYAENGTEDFPFSGIYRVTANVVVKQMAADVTGSFGFISDPIFHTFLGPNIESLLINLVSNYYVYKLILSETSDDTNSDAWAQKYTFEIVCALTP